MSTPIAQFAGVVSGFNYQTLVDAIIQQESAPVTRMQTQQDTIKAQQTALATYRGLLTTLRTASGALTDSTSFASASATSTVLTGSKANVTAVPDATAVPGDYVVKVSQLARAAKLSGTTQTSATTALALSGSFTVNGQSITVAAGDTLNDIRDRINALNSGTTPINVTASVLGVSPTDQRLVLTSKVTGAAGIALADSGGGTVLQSLGLLNNLGAVPNSAVLVSGADAQFQVDNVPITRSSNVVSDVIQGVTLTLTSEEAGASTAISVAKDSGAAQTAMQSFVDAYNAVVNFIKDQGTVTDTSTPPLHGDSMLRTARSGLPAILLQTITGAPSDFATAAKAGISVTRDGTVTFDSATFSAAFKNRYTDLTGLFAEKSSTTGANLSFVASGAINASGTFNVDITAPATSASLASTGFSGAYDDGGTPDTITVTDQSNGKSADVVLTTGMTTAQIVTAFQNAFTASGITITVAPVGNDIQLTHPSTGSHAGITVALAGTGDSPSTLWASGSTVLGTDVQGTIDGLAATGAGNMLVGNSGTTASGLSVRYDGTGTGTVGTVTVNLGTGALINRLLDSFVQNGTGLIDTRTTSLTNQSSGLDSRIAAKNERLALRRAALVAQFVQMESVISSLKTSSASLLAMAAASGGSSNSSGGGFSNGSTN